MIGNQKVIFVVNIQHVRFKVNGQYLVMMDA